MVVIFLVLGVAASARSAGAGDAKAVVDKAIKALGGEALDGTTAFRFWPVSAWALRSARASGWWSAAMR